MGKTISLLLVLVFCWGCSGEANGTHRPYVISKAHPEPLLDSEEEVSLP